MGLAELFLGSSNPIAKYVAGNRNAVRGAFAGFGRGTDFGSGLANAALYANEGAVKDDAYATSVKEKADREAQLQKSIDYLKSTNPDMAAMVAAGMDPNAAFQALLKPKSGDAMPANIREWEYFNALPPEQQSEYLRMKRANPYLDLGTGFGQPDPVNPGALGGPVIPKNGDVPTGFQQTAPGEIAPMPGSEPDIERRGKQVKAESAINTLEQKNAVAVSAIDEALSQVNWSNTGNVMGNIGGVPVVGQGAHDLGKTLDTIKANIGFEELQTMRDNSPTGGALGQVTERELAFLQSTIANIEQSQSEDQLKKNLKTLRDFIAGSQERRRAAYLQQFGGGSAPAGGVDDVDAILRDLGI